MKCGRWRDAVELYSGGGPIEGSCGGGVLEVSWKEVTKWGRLAEVAYRGPLWWFLGAFS
jgi:hypothetical protein